MVEPLPDEERRGRFRTKAAKSAYSATISPFADDDDPHGTRLVQRLTPGDAWRASIGDTYESKFGY